MHFMLRTFSVNGPNPITLLLMNVMSPRKTEPSLRWGLKHWELHTTQQRSLPTVHRSDDSRRERQPVNHKPPDAPHNVVSPCLQVPGFAHDECNLLGFLEEKPGKRSFWFTQPHPHDKAQNQHWWTWVDCASKCVILKTGTGVGALGSSCLF